MIARLAAVVGWLLAGHALLGGIYWMLLNVPESNTVALAASALLALLLLVGAGIVDTTALLALRPSWPWRRALTRSVALLPMFLLALLLWLAVSWTCGWLEAVHDARRGEIDAWLIARFDWTNTAGLHRTIDHALTFVRYIVGLSLAVGLLGTAAFDGAGAALRLRWLWSSLTRQVVVVAVAVFGLIWLPWQAVYWHPRVIPATSTELAFVSAKLLVLALLTHLGWALVLWSAQRDTPARAIPSHAAPVAAPPPPPPTIAPDAKPGEETPVSL